MKRQRILAKLTGFSLILMALLAGFSFGFAFPKFFNSNQLDFAQKNLTENMELYKSMLLGILLVIMLDILVSWTLFQYFKNDNKKLALLSLIFRIIYTLIFGIAGFYLTNNIGQTIDNNTVILENYKLFEKVWTIGLMFFGIHLLFVGWLMKLHKLIPNFLWYLTIMAGASYILAHLLKTTHLQLTEFTNALNNILALPMALGELGLAVWLIVKGGKIESKETAKSTFAIGNFSCSADSIVVLESSVLRINFSVKKTLQKAVKM